MGCNGMGVGGGEEVSLRTNVWCLVLLFNILMKCMNNFKNTHNKLPSKSDTLSSAWLWMMMIRFANIMNANLVWC